MKLTDLEADVLRDIVARRDPWHDQLGNSRRVSQAIGRLIRKGAVDRGAERYVVTDAGRAALADERRDEGEET